MKTKKTKDTPVSVASNAKRHVKHTPTPWKTFTAKEGVVICTENNRHVALITDSTGIEGFQDKANAAFIVRAVNSFDALTAENTRLRDAHEELLHALKVLVSCADDATEQDPDDAVEYAREVIAKAEGSQVSR